MENETVDYGKVQEWYTQQKVWCSRRAWIRLSFFKAVKCGVSIAITRYLGYGNQTCLRERTVKMMYWEEALRYRGFWGQKVESRSVVEKPSYR